MARRGPGGTPATVALTRAGVAFTMHSYEHDPAAASYGLEAAAALGLPPEQVFKTLLARSTARSPSRWCRSRDADLKALAGAVGGKRAAMADPAAAERVTGLRRRRDQPARPEEALPTVVDASAAAYDAVYVSGGRRGLDLGLAPADLVRLTSARYAPLAAP